MKYLFCILVASLLVLLSCGENKKEDKFSHIPIPSSTTFEPKKPIVKPSRYASPSDTIEINGLQIILDSVVVNKSKENNNQRTYQQLMQRNKKGFTAYVQITNKGTKKTTIPFVDIVEEQRVAKESFSYGGGNEDDFSFRMGSRMFFQKNAKKLQVYIKPKQTLKGAYSLYSTPSKYMALSFWYFEGDAFPTDEGAGRMIKQMSKQNQDGEDMIKILPHDIQLEDVGFDITGLL